MELLLWIYLLPALSVAFALHRFFSKPKTEAVVTHEKQPPQPPQFAKAARLPGGWLSSSFKAPRPAPYPEWSLETTKPLSYRPFRYGPKYFITMGLRRMGWDEWIELDNEFLSYHSQKAARILERGDKCCYTAPDAFPSAYELLDELAEYLPARYPSLYKRTPVGIDNLATGESFNIVQRPLVEDPMVMAARWVQDDLAIMIEGTDGQYYLKAGCTLLTGFWRLQDKLGMNLDQIHFSGDVPGYKAKLQKGINNFFTRIQPDGPMLRNNYFIQVDGELPWSSSIGSEDSREGEFGWFTAEKDKPIEHLHFRSERQSLRRLPKSGGVVFTIRTYFAPVTEIAKEPFVPGRLASGVRSWDPEVAKYKGRDRFERVLLEYLDKEHEKQVEAGLPVDKEDETRSYPW